MIDKILRKYSRIRQCVLDNMRRYHIDVTSSFGVNTIIGHNASICNSTVGSGCAIGPWSRVESSVLADNVMLGKESSVIEGNIERWVSIQESATLARCKVESYTYIGCRSSISDTTIGRFCSIGHNVFCGPGDHPSRWLSSSPVFYSDRKQCGFTFCESAEFKETQLVVLGNDCWVGANVFIRNGIRVGHGSIIGAGAVVVKDVPEYSIVGGVPAKLLRMRFDESEIQELLAIKWWNWDPQILAENAPRFRTENVADFIKWARSLRI